MEMSEVEFRMIRVLSSAEVQLPEGQLLDMKELVTVGEPGVALENLYVQLQEYDVHISAVLQNEMTALGKAMGLDVSCWFVVNG